MSFPPSNYIIKQNSVRRWDNILNNLRKEIAHLKKLTLKGLNGTLTANHKGLVVDNGVDPQPSIGAGFLSLDRIYLNFNVNYNYEVADEIIDPELWAISYGVQGGIVLDGGHHYTVPSSVGDLSLLDSKVYLQVVFNSNYEYIYDNDLATLAFSLVKNNTETVALCKYAEQFINFNIVWKTLHADMNDIFECEVGDTFDIYTSNNGEIKLNIISGSTDTIALFSILRVIPNGDL